MTKVTGVAGLRGVVVAALVVGGGAACGTDPDEGRKGAAGLLVPVTTTAVTGSGDAGVPGSSVGEPPVLPTPAREPTRAGAEAFLGYFWAVYSHAYRSGDETTLAAISEAGCGFCAGAVRNVRVTRAAGHRVTGGQVTVRVAVAAPGDPARGLLVDAVVDQRAAVTRTSGGATVRSVAPVTGHRVQAVLRWTDGAWTVMGVNASGTPQDALPPDGAGDPGTPDGAGHPG